MSLNNGGDVEALWYYIPSDALNVNGVSFNDYFLSTLAGTFLAVLLVYIILLLFRYQEFKDVSIVKNSPFIIFAMTFYQLMFFFSWKRPSLSSSSSIYTTTMTILISSAIVYSIFFILVKYTFNGDDEAYTCVFLYFVTLLTSLSTIPIYVSSLPDMNIVPSLLRRDRDDRQRFFISTYTQYARPVFLVVFAAAVLIAIWMRRMNGDDGEDNGNNDDVGGDIWYSVGKRPLVFAVPVILSLLGYYFYDRRSSFTAM